MSLSDLYLLTKLPRASGASEKGKLSRSSTSDELHIGVSGASVSNYVLKPSPKLVWSHSIPPSFIITSIEQVDDRYIVGIYNKAKKTYLLQIIHKLENDSKVLKEIDVSSKIIDIKTFENKTIVISEDAIFAIDQDFKQVWTSANLYTAVFSEFLNNGVILVVEYDTKKNKVNFKLISDVGTEINSKIIEHKLKLKNPKYTFNEGILYQYSNNSITTYHVPHFKEAKTIKLADLNINEATDKFSFISPALDRLIIAQDNDIYLVNTNFNIILSHLESPKSKVEILQAEKPASKSHRASQQLFSVILRDNDISGLTFSLDSNTLRDSLGKNTSVIEDKNVHKVVPSILNIKDETFEVNDILNSKDLNVKLLEFLNAENDYYTEKDKVVDYKFIKTVVSHIFNQKVLPERALTYLLTHPLFPTIDGLLDKLRSKPRLLRQAVVTANIPVEQLLQELNTTDNDDIFKDIVARLLEFPKDKLNFKDLDNFKIVERIINLNSGHELISILIDSSGLFTWNDELISKLQKVLTTKIDALNSVSKTLAVIQQSDMKNLKTVKKVPVYSIEELEV